MKNVLTIYKRDMRNIITNWASLVVIIALMILPALYAWFNIKSAWDPYGNTSGILVAVVNKDKGSEYRGQKVNVGSELVQKLKNNNSIGWKFVDEKDAEHGVKYGKYYASITIPENFSERIISVTQDVPQKADLIYSVNEKRNAVAPKITQKGVTGIQQQLTTTFVETINGIIFDVFNKLGVELEKGKPVLESFINIIFEIDNRIPEINKAVDDFYNGALTLQELIKRVQSNLPIVEDTINKASDVVNKGEGFLIKVRDGIRNITPFIKEQLLTIDNIAHTTEADIGNAADLIASNPIKAKDLLVKVRDRYSNGINNIDSNLELLKSLDNNSNNKVVTDFIDAMGNIKGRLQTQLNAIDSIIASIDKKEQISSEIVNKMKQDSVFITGFLDSVVNNFDSTITPAINDTMNNSVALADNTLKLLKDAKNDLPIISNLMQKVYTGTAIGIEDIVELKRRLPAVEQSIHSLAERLRGLNSNDQLNELIRILKLNARKESEFIANPVNIVQNRIFPIPNYGSAMTPFFTTLSLWVGALILVSILSVEIHNHNYEENIKINQAFLGRYLTFVTIALFQALVVTLGDIYLLKVYVSNPTVFVIYAMFISIVFTMVVYTLVSVFGNAGKALSMILLVLQISASGGTFPIEVTPPFFQHLNPLLPFTYAIGGMREAVGGVLWDMLKYNASVLSIYFFIFILIGISMKRIFKGTITKFVEKFKQSGLVEE